MTKITAEHLGRGAFVYIRQSTADQLLHNTESRRRQYGLADRARQLGWSSVEVIADDPDRSGGRIKRPVFERLLAAICAGRGAVGLGVAGGEAKAGRDRIENDPDQRRQDALSLVFSKFAELQSVRQAHISLRDEGIALPVKSHQAAEGRCTVWKLPLYNAI